MARSCEDAGGQNRLSLQHELSWALLGGILVLWLLLAAVGLTAVYHDARALLNAQLDQTARLLLAVVKHELQEGYPDDDDSYLGVPPSVPAIFSRPGIGPLETPPIYQVRDRRGRVILRSDGADALPENGTAGFHDHWYDGTHWRVLTVVDPVRGLTVSAAQPADYQRRLTQALSVRYLLPLVLALPLLVVIVRWSVRRGLRGLALLTDQVAARSTTDRRPLTSAAVPCEARPLTEALDDLLTRLHRVSERERRFIADAAHELRTPLAGIKTQGQLARSSDDPARRDAALDGLLDGVDRSARLVTQLLTLARLDPDQSDLATAPTPLHSTVRTVLADLAPQALAAGVELVLDAADDCSIALDESLLATLVRNLVENAINASRSGQTVTLETHCDTADARLRIRDQGPGIRADLQRRVFERFYRGPGNLTPGAGLGLSIVKRIADRGQVRLSLHNLAAGGLQVEVCFDLAPSLAECAREPS